MVDPSSLQEQPKSAKAVFFFFFLCRDMVEGVLKAEFLSGFDSAFEVFKADFSEVDVLGFMVFLRFLRLLGF